MDGGPAPASRRRRDPWLPLGDAAARNVADQRDDPGSTLHLVRDLIALRRERADSPPGAYATLPAPDGAWAWQRGDGTAVALNLSDAPVTSTGSPAPCWSRTDRARDGERVDRRARAGPWSGAVIDVG